MTETKKPTKQTAKQHVEKYMNMGVGKIIDKDLKKPMRGRGKNPKSHLNMKRNMQMVKHVKLKMAPINHLSVKKHKATSKTKPK